MISQIKSHNLLLFVFLLFLQHANIVIFSVDVMPTENCLAQDMEVTFRNVGLITSFNIRKLLDIPTRHPAV